MGFFTWTYCNCKQKTFGYGSMNPPIYVLIPAEFIKDYGGKNLKCTYYDGYGEFCGYDIYDLVADWNRKYLTDEFIKTIDFVPQEMLFAFRDEGEEGVKKFLAKKKKKPQGKYWLDSEWKRNIGIAIACVDKDHARLKYPIKITQKDIPYEKQKGYSHFNTD